MPPDRVNDIPTEEQLSELDDFKFDQAISVQVDPAGAARAHAFLRRTVRVQRAEIAELRRILTPTDEDRAELGSLIALAQSASEIEDVDYLTPLMVVLSERQGQRAENERLTSRLDSVIGMVEPWPCECREDTWNGEPVMQTCLRCAVLRAARPNPQTEEIF